MSVRLRAGGWFQCPQVAHPHVHTHVLEHPHSLSLPISPILQLKASQFWKSKFWMGNLDAQEWKLLVICMSVTREPWKEYNVSYNRRKKCIVFLSSRKEKSLLDQRWDSFQTCLSKLFLNWLVFSWNSSLRPKKKGQIIACRNPPQTGLWRFW